MRKELNDSYFRDEEFAMKFLKEIITVGSFELTIAPGMATADDLAELFLSMSNLTRAAGLGSLNVTTITPAEGEACVVRLERAKQGEAE